MFCVHSQIIGANKQCLKSHTRPVLSVLGTGLSSFLRSQNSVLRIFFSMMSSFSHATTSCKRNVLWDTLNALHSTAIVTRWH